MPDDDDDDDNDNNNIMPPSASATARAPSAATTTTTTTRNTSTSGAPTAKKAKSTSGPVIDILDGRPYNYNLSDGSFIAYYTEGMVDFADAVFLVNGVMDEKGHRIRIAPHGDKVIFERGIRRNIYSKDLLKILLTNDDRVYDVNSARTVAYDNATFQSLLADGNTADQGPFLWGKEQVLTLKCKVQPEPDEIAWQPYSSGLVIDGHMQFNTIVLCRMKIADQRMTKLSKGTNKRPVTFSFSQDSDDGSPPAPANCSTARG